MSADAVVWVMCDLHMPGASESASGDGSRFVNVHATVCIDTVPRP